MARRNIKIKPGKNQSRFGFVAGLIFVCVGLFIVIPTFGAFGIIWTAMAGFICFAHFKNGFTDKGMATHEIIIDDEQISGLVQEDGFINGKLNSSYADVDTLSNKSVNSGYLENTKSPEEDIENKLIKLNSLYEQKLITKEEYDEKRKQLLKEF